MENITKIVDACLPSMDDTQLKQIQQVLYCTNVMILDIDPRPHTQINRCHANVERQVQWYGGEKVQGYYIAVSESSNKWTAIKHSVWKKDNELIDVTPVNDDRTKNVFVWGNDQLYTSVYFDGTVLHTDDRVVLETP
jgi:hypothetical protein